MMGKLSNLLTMIELLNTGQKYSIEELSNLLEVTPRMVRFYKEEMEKAGIFIDTIYGPYGGYVLSKRVNLPMRSITKEEITFLEKNLKNLSEEEKKETKLILDKLNGIVSSEVMNPFTLKDENLEKYNLLSRAIKEKRKVKILYYSYHKGENERVIDPYQIFHLEQGWAVAAYCEVKKDLRHFEFSRILKIELLEEKYTVLK